MNNQQEFIAFDYCGFSEKFGRYTHIPSNKTIVCRPNMSKKQWAKAQLVFLKNFPNLNVFKCPKTYNTEDGQLIGSTNAICQKLEEELNVNGI